MLHGRRAQIGYMAGPRCISAITNDLSAGQSTSIDSRRSLEQRRCCAVLIRLAATWTLSMPMHRSQPSARLREI